MAAAASSSGGSFEYDVFINFRGEDTRRGFVCHLNKALKQKALDTFKDSEELRKGGDLSDQLVEAIKKSRVSIVVFSENYASSTWCLKELVQILECMDRQHQIVVPVFYEVDPSHVRKCKEKFAEAFAKHERDSNLDEKELESWKSSLTRATNLSGHVSTDFQDDIQLIKIIVEDILQKLIRISPIEPDGSLIGMDYHMEKLDSLLELEVNDFRSIGIWGMGGLGKSTIASVVYEKISAQFEHKCFLDNVKEGFLKNGAEQMVKELLIRLLKIDDPRILDGGLNKMRKKLGKRKILLVLDDVNALDQIETLIGKDPSFGDGSRIIITTRDKSLLAGCLVYEPELLRSEEALKLFRLHAFRTVKLSESNVVEYDKISRRAVEYGHGLPLALKVLGGLLNNKTVHEWEYELKKIKEMSITFLDDNKIGRVLLASYDGLDESQKKIFLDIACFFVGAKKCIKYITRFHESCGFFPESGLRVLEERSLVTFSRLDYPEMHDLIQEMARYIVCQDLPDPGRRSRLWHHEDVLQVLAQNTSAEAVEGISLDLTKLKELLVNTEAFAGMKNLRIIQIESELRYLEEAKACKQQVSGDSKFLSNELTKLRFLIWHGCPLKSLPHDIQPTNLIKIEMHKSRIEQLWEGSKPLPKLEDMDLSSSAYLKEIPDLSKATNLKKLKLSGCTRLRKFPNVSANMKQLIELDLDETAIREMPSSVNDLPALQRLSFRHCSELRSIPTNIGIKSLETLDLYGCLNLEEFPEISPVMENLKELILDWTAIRGMPSSVNDLPTLERLRLNDCSELRSLPSSIHMKSLKELHLGGCSKLEEFPEISQVMEYLCELNLRKTAIRELPSSIDNLTGLHRLYMRDCTSLVSLPDEICNLTRLERVHLEGCSKLRNLPDDVRLFQFVNICDLKGSGIRNPPLSIFGLTSETFDGLYGLTAPLSMRPTNPSSFTALSYLVSLNLSDCILLESPDAIAHFSSLRKLWLCRNEHLGTLPAAMNRLPHLKKLYLTGCKSLKSIPELASSIQVIKADNCTSLETVSTPQLPCDSAIRFTFENCLKLESTELFIDIVESCVVNYQDCEYYHLMILPGSEIPDWFNHQSVGSSATVQLPTDTYANQLQGFAVCVITNFMDEWIFPHDAYCCATFKGYDNQEYKYPLSLTYSYDYRKLEHKILAFINFSKEWHNECKFTDVTFKSRIPDFSVPYDAEMPWGDCPWITSCGVRLFPINSGNEERNNRER